MKTRATCLLRPFFTYGAALKFLLLSPAISHADTMYVTAGSWMGDIFKIESDGTTSVFQSFHTYSSQGVSGIEVDGAGNVYAASYYGNTITRYSPAGTGTLFANTGISYPQGIAFDNAGNLYATEYNGNKIARYTPNGTRIEFASNTGGGLTLYGPQDLAFDAAGNLFVANWGNSIVKFAPNGTSTTFATAGLNHPGGLAFDASGNLFVSNTGNNSILKYSPNGQVSVFASTGLNTPRGLAFDSAGNLYVAHATEIAKFTPSGAMSTFATTGTESPWFIAIQPVPEPSLGALLGLGGIVGFALQRGKGRLHKSHTRCSTETA